MGLPGVVTLLIEVFKPMYNWCSQRIYRGVFICWILPWRLTVRLWKWVEGPKRRGLSSNHQFAGANCQTSGEYFINKIWWRSKKQATLNFQKENPQKFELIYIYRYLYTYIYIYMSFCEICWDVFFFEIGPPKTNFRRASCCLWSGSTFRASRSGVGNQLG